MTHRGLLNNTDLNCKGLLHDDFFDKYGSSVNVFSPPYDFHNIFFSLAYLVVRIQCIIQVTYRISINWLFPVIPKASSQK